MQQTTNYQLSQWEKTDRILMDDFNRDNLIIENGFQALKAALETETAARDREAAALRAANLTVKLADVTAAREAAQIDVDVSRVDFTQYGRIDLSLDLGESSDGRWAGSMVYLRANGESSYQQCYPDSAHSDSADTSDYLGAWYYEHKNAAGQLSFNSPCAGAYIHCLFFLAKGGKQSFSMHNNTTFPWEALRTLNFLSSHPSLQIPKGTRIILYGVRK